MASTVPRIVLDGTMAYGSRIVTINSVTYKCNNIKISRPKTEANQEGIVGDPTERRATHGRSQFSAELQLATSTTAYPAFGMTLTVTVDANYGAETFVLDPVPYDEDNTPGKIRVVAITAVAVFSGITTVL